MSRYVMALDQGTTSSRAMLFDESGGVVAVDQYEFPQHFPKPGWVEHDAEEIWDSQLRAARGGLERAGATGDEVAAIGITNQRETTLVWDRATGCRHGNAQSASRNTCLPSSGRKYPQDCRCAWSSGWSSSAASARRPSPWRPPCSTPKRSRPSNCSSTLAFLSAMSLASLMTCCPTNLYFRKNFQE